MGARWQKAIKYICYILLGWPMLAMAFYMWWKRSRLCPMAASVVSLNWPFNSGQEVNIISPKLGVTKRERKNKWAHILTENSPVQRNTSLWCKWDRPETGVSSVPTEQRGMREVSNPNGPKRPHSTSVNPTIVIKQEQQNHLVILLSEMALSW